MTPTPFCRYEEREKGQVLGVRYDGVPGLVDVSRVVARCRNHATAVIGVCPGHLEYGIRTLTAGEHQALFLLLLRSHYPRMPPNVQAVT